METVRRLERDEARSKANPTLKAARGVAQALQSTVDELFPEATA